MIGRKVKITGTVQGVGFRPHVFRLANQTQLAGYVVNRGADVEIFVQGCSSDVQYFVKGLQFELPLLANIDTIICENSDVIPGLKKFSIYPSFNAAHSAVKVADYAICKRCLAEFNHPENHRFQYAFISCTECGPRYSILKQYPLDRKNTSYRNFVMCQQCRKEYEDPENRRFHAQNMSCSACGPGFYLSYNNTRLTDENAALDHCCRSLAAGKIVCVKGISGYRLVCDAR
ncbi:MAG TPA: carbamoyltransferase HypF, partial [Gammaproteobacteria bacterium]|nr:carbamoyltransferase HypF [Gammaproteobacteria bacterium]